MAKRSLALTALLALGPLLNAETVRFKTSDGIEIVADWHPARRPSGAATIVCLPMYRHTRATYRPLLSPLAEKGFNVLVLDLRGHGESAPDLAPRVAARDSVLFNAMHLDVEAALGFLEREKGCDTTRIGLVGASVGCSVAVDATVRMPERVRAVVLLTPGSRYLGVPTLEHLERWPGAPVLTLCSNEERAKSREVIAKLARFQRSGHAYFDRRGIHGTRMFGAVKGVEDRIAGFLAGILGPETELRIQRWPAGDTSPSRAGFLGKLHRPGRVVGASRYSLMTWVSGEVWSVGAEFDTGFKGRIEFEVDDERIGFEIDPAASQGSEIGSMDGKIKASVADSRGRRWLVFRRAWVAGTRLHVAFRPDGGEIVGIPAGSAKFRCEIEPVTGS